MPPNMLGMGFRSYLDVDTEAQVVANRVEDETPGDDTLEETEQLEPVNASLNMNKANVQSPVAQLRSELASESRRIAGIRKLCAGRHDELEAKSIEQGWSLTKTELEVLRSERPQAPGVNIATSSGFASLLINV